MLRTALLSAALPFALWANGASAAEGVDEIDPNQPVAQTVIDVAGWVIASGDNRGLPFAILDKGAAQLLVFDKEGKLLGLAPALIGSAVGDHSAPGVAERELSDIPMEDRTTPAGRFLAGYGPATGGATVLWVDYASAVSIHPVINTNRAEERPQRLSSPTPDDNRITHGCINVSRAFYNRVVRANFKTNGVFYILPDQERIADVLPGFRPPRRNWLIGSRSD